MQDRDTDRRRACTTPFHHYDGEEQQGLVLLSDLLQQPHDLVGGRHAILLPIQPPVAHCLQGLGHYHLELKEREEKKYIQMAIILQFVSKALINKKFQLVL